MRPVEEAADCLLPRIPDQREQVKQRMDTVADFLGLAGRTVVVQGVANRKSVAWHVARVLTEAGAKVVYIVRSEERRVQLAKLVPDADILVCDVAFPEQIEALGKTLTDRGQPIHGYVHSLAFADYSAGWLPFHETPRAAFLQAVDLSCYSFIAVSNALSKLFDP